MKKTILITGASSQVGVAIRPYLHAEYNLRLHYHSNPIKPIRPGEQVVQGDITILSSVLEMMEGVNAVVHLAGQARSKASWEQVKAPNIDGTYNVFEAVRLTGIPKIVFASTNRVTGMAEKSGECLIHPRQPVRPDSFYAVTKVFGEALARYYVDHFEISSIICLRIGWVLDAPHDEKSLKQWMSPRDCAQLIGLSLETQRQYGIYYGASKNDRLEWDISNACEELGYLPQDNSEVYADQILLDN